MRYRTLLFDADNTLFDFSRAEREALADTLVYCGITPADTLIKAYSEINDRMWKRLERGEIAKEALREARFEEFCKAFGFDADVPQMSKTYIDFLSEKAHLIDGAGEICAALAARYQLYIVTNGIKTVQRRRFAACALKPYFPISLFPRRSASKNRMSAILRLWRHAFPNLRQRPH